MARFLNRLNPLIARKVELQTYFTLDDVFKLALKVEKRKKEKHVFTKPFPKKQVSSNPPFKPFIPPKPKAHHGLTRARPWLFLHQRNCLRSLRVRSTLNVKGIDTSNMILQTEGS